MPKPDRAELRSRIADELGRARVLSSQVTLALETQFEVAESDAIPWLREHLAELESYEAELLLSPLFTPTVETRLRMETVLEEDSIAPREADGIVMDLVAGGAAIHLSQADESLRASAPEVIVDRFVRLLHLDSSLPLEKLAAFRPIPPRVRCHLRDRTWSRRSHRELLPTLFGAASRVEGELDQQVEFLTSFVRAHRPATPLQCVEFLDNVVEAYESDLESHDAGSRSFYDPQLKATYGGTRRASEDVRRDHEKVIELARRLGAELRR